MIKMKKIILILIFLTLLLANPLSVLASGPKYSMRQRFGVGSNGGDLMKQLGNGWYFDWVYTGGKYGDIEYMGLVGAGATGVPGSTGEVPDSPASSVCQNKKDYILNHKDAYPDNMMWTVGNELGWDDSRTANQYADDFVKWRTCLKSINPTFRVGSGAMMDVYTKLPRDWSQGCTQTPEVNGGIAYFRTYMNKLKNVYQVIPDFFVAHAYTYCSGGVTVDAFKNSIVNHRKLISEFGLQNKDLIIKEWADFSDNSISYLQNTVNYLLTATDQNLGNPDDEYRLVQKWAWFLFVPENSDWKNAWLSNNGQLTPLGQAYKAMIPDPSPIGSYDAGYWVSCAVTGWTCDNSYPAASIPVDIYMDGHSPSNYLGSTVAETLHNSQDAGPNNACFGTAHDFQFNLPANLHDGQQHTYYPLAINIDSAGNRKDQNESGAWIDSWLGIYKTNQMPGAFSPPIPGDLNHDGKVDINDYNQLINNDYTNIFDYNNLVVNFGTTQ